MSYRPPVVFVESHPDDVIVYSGGWLLKLVEQRTETTVVCLRPSVAASTKMSRMSVEIGFQYEEVPFERSRGRALDMLRNVISKQNKATIVTHWHLDTHINHRRAFDAVSAVVKDLKIASYGAKTRRRYSIVMLDSYYSVGIGREPFPGKSIVDISRFFKKKMEMIDELSDQYRQIYLRMVPTMAMFYGGKIGRKYGEAYLEGASLSSIDGGFEPASL